MSVLPAFTIVTRMQYAPTPRILTSARAIRDLREMESHARVNNCLMLSFFLCFH